MKANQFLRSNDDAVSPVIAVILMVAITVVLAATVYVWVSGFGSNTNTSPAHTLSMTSAQTISTDSGADLYWKNYTVSSADPTLTYGDMRLTIGGSLASFSAAGCSLAPAATNATQWGACSAGSGRAATASVSAGDKITIACFQTDTNCLSDKDLLVLDVEANSVMVTLKVR